VLVIMVLRIFLVDPGREVTISTTSMVCVFGGDATMPFDKTALFDIQAAEQITDLQAAACTTTWI